MGSTAMDKKKDASSSSSRKISSHKKLMLRVHIPVSGSSLFLPFGSWRGLGMFFSDMERSERQGERERCSLRRALEFGACWAGGAPLQQPSPPHLGWAQEWGLGPPCSAGSPGCSSVRGTEEYPHYPSFRSDSYSLLYKCSCALGCGFGSVCLIPSQTCSTV